MSLVDKSHRVLATCVFRAQEFAKGHTTFRVLRDMEKMQWVSTDQLMHAQQERLALFLRSAATNVPYYADVFRNLHMDPRDRLLPDLEKLPFLSKDVIRQNLAHLRSKSAGRVRSFSTGGSTGAPLTFFLGATRISSDVAASMRAESWFGVSSNHPELAIWGSPVELTKQVRLRDLRDRILRTRLLSAFEMNAAT